MGGGGADADWLLVGALLRHVELVALENVVVRIEKCLAGFEHQGAAVVVLAHTLLGRANTTLLNALPVSDSELLSHLSQFIGLATVTKN